MQSILTFGRKQFRKTAVNIKNCIYKDNKDSVRDFYSASA